jgi:Kef-type K+ transport system membrane component KefB
MAEVSYKEANRRYRRAFIPAMIVYGVVVFAGSFWLKTFEEPPIWASILVAILSVAPIGVVLLLMWRLMRETDEYTRMQQALSMAAGGLITAFVCMAWGFLELYDLAPSMWTFLAGPIFFLSYGVINRFVMKGQCEPGFGNG